MGVAGRRLRPGPAAQAGAVEAEPVGGVVAGSALVGDLESVRYVTEDVAMSRLMVRASRRLGLGPDRPDNRP